MKRERFITDVSQKIKDGLCDLFVGSGFSAPSGLPTWGSFLQPFLNDLGITIKDGDDLPLLAQYIVNSNTGNRNIISEAVHKTFGKDYPTNRYHDILSNYPVNTVWTTNYDNLLEKAFSDYNPRVIISEDSLLHPYSPSGVDIIKLHGDATNAAKTIVLTREDYFKYFLKNPMLTQRLKEAIINKSILFLGYSYQDTDIQQIMFHALQMKQQISNTHYILMCELERYENETDIIFNERKKRFSLWISELNRIGIRELVVPKDEIAGVISEIGNKAKNMSVFVSGKHHSDNTLIPIAKKIGTILAENDDVVLNYGQSSGIGNATMSSFMESVIDKKQDIVKRMRIFPNPYASNPAYSDDPSQLPNLKSARIPLLTDTRVFILFPGGIGTMAEAEIALQKQIPILPIIINKDDYNNQVIKKVLESTASMNIIKDISTEYYKVLTKKEIPSKEQIEHVINEATNVQ